MFTQFTSTGTERKDHWGLSLENQAFSGERKVELAFIAHKSQRQRKEQSTVLNLYMNKHE